MITIYEDNKEELEKPVVQKNEEKEENKPSESGHAESSNSLYSPYMEKFLQDFEKRLSEEEKNSTGQVIKVSEVLGRLARLYEKIRTTVEYKGEHVLRRNAIERILKRLVWEQESVRSNIDNRKVAETLAKELIWARYLPNGKIPITKHDELKKVIDKYIYFLKNLDNLPNNVSPTKIRSWIWGIASSEIEDVLDPSYRELYVQLMYAWFTDFFVWDDPKVDAHDKEVQIYLAVHRAFTKSDDPIMRYHLLLKEISNWRDADVSELNKLILQFPSVYQEIENHLNFPGRFILYRKVQKHAAAFDIFREITAEESTKIRDLLKSKKKFEEKIRTVCSAKYQQIKQKVSTGIVRSIIYIFVTKVFFAMIIEIPYEIFVYEDIRYLPLSINLVVAPIMMWLIGLSIRIPGAKNTEAVVNRLETVVYTTKNKNKQEFSLNKAENKSSLSRLFGLLYMILFVLVFGSITYVLTLLNFTVFGILIFFVFLSLVLLFAFRVRYNANQLKVDTQDESFFSHLTSYLTLPFLNFGFYLSKGLAKINIFTIFLDFLIEVPLKNVIEIFEEWTSFIREKKEEVVEIPE